MATIKGTRITILGADFSAKNIGNSNPINDYFNRGAITDTNQKNVFLALNQSLFNSGILGILDRLFLFTENTAASKLNFINPSGFAASFASGYESRFTKAGVSFNKDLLINIPFDQPSGINNLSFGVYNATSEAGGNTNNNFLCETSETAGYMMLARNLANTYGYRIGSTIQSFGTADSGVGLMSADIKDTTSKLYKNGVLSQTKTETGFSGGTTTMGMGDKTINTTRAFFSAPSLTADQHLALYNSLSAFDAAWNAL